MQKAWKITETLAYGYSSESTQGELSNRMNSKMTEFRSSGFQKNLRPTLWMKVASELEGLMSFKLC